MSDGHQEAMALRAAYLSMHRQADAVLADHGVTANQFVLLTLLDEQDDVTQSDLVQRATSDPNTIRPMLIALERKGLVVRNAHPSDGRAWSVRLTSRGRSMFKRLWSQSQPFRDRLTDSLEPGESDQLVALLQKVAVAMSEGLAAAVNGGK